MPQFPHVVAEGVTSAQGSSVVPELSIWTPASASPSKPVTGLPAPRQLSSSLGSANQTPTELRSVRVCLALSKANASSTMSLKELSPCRGGPW